MQAQNFPFLGCEHTYPWLYLEKKKCAWKMTLITFLKCLLVNLNPEFKKNLWRDFWKNTILRFLPYKAESDLRAKSLSRAPFKATIYQNATNMWFPIEDLRKKCQLFLKFLPLCIGKGEKTIFSIHTLCFIRNVYKERFHSTS